MKPGDKIVCIDIKGIGKSKPIALTLYNTYTVVEDNNSIGNSISVLNDDNEVGQYWKERFITLDKWREQQLNKLI
jgi:hypothetical protein